MLWGQDMANFSLIFLSSNSTICRPNVMGQGMAKSFLFGLNLNSGATSLIN